LSRKQEPLGTQGSAAPITDPLATQASAAPPTDPLATQASAAPITDPLATQASAAPPTDPLATQASAAPTTGPSGEESQGVEPARDLSHEHLRGLLEALVFASDKPMSTGELARMASAPARHVQPILRELRQHYAQRGIVLDEIAGGWVFRTSAQFAPFVRELSGDRPVKLTRAQIETLAITAYRQPITRPEIDDIRGVDSGATLKLLLERDLLRILGRKDEPGRPLLYGTTTHFLQFFGLKALKDLPPLREFTELSEDSRRAADEELRAAPPPTEPHPTFVAGDAVRTLDGSDQPDTFGNDPGDAHDTAIHDAPPTGDMGDDDQS
jgi:segregation and condensation protein B